MANELIPVRYIGSKAEKRDNIFSGSGRMWAGAGSVIQVPAADAAAYLQHDTVWNDGRVEWKGSAAVKPKLAPGEDPKAVTSSESEVKKERLAKVLWAVKQLDEHDSGDYTSDGSPRVKRVEEVLGDDTSAEEISEALKSA